MKHTKCGGTNCEYRRVAKGSSRYTLWYCHDCKQEFGRTKVRE